MKCCNKDIFNYRGLNEAEIYLFFFYITISKLAVLSQFYGAALLNRTIPHFIPAISIVQQVSAKSKRFLKNLTQILRAIPHRAGHISLTRI